MKNYFQVDEGEGKGGKEEKDPFIFNRSLIDFSLSCSVGVRKRHRKKPQCAA